MRRRPVRHALVGAALLALAAAARGAEGTPIPLPAWLCGRWVMERGERTVEETWLDPRGGTLFAIGRTLRGDRLLEFEFLRIERRGDSLAFVAQPNGRPPTEFRLVERGERSVRFENRAHDFPQVVRYWSETPGTLSAEVSGTMNGEERAIRFEYRSAAFTSGGKARR